MVYLIHFDEPLCHAKHYIGYCDDGRLEERIKEHRAGYGARLLEVLNEKGIGYKVVKTWANKTREFERKLKNQKHAGRHCPCCSGKGGREIC